MSFILYCRAKQDQPFLAAQWWCSRTTSKQQQAIVDLKKVYWCFTVSNDKVSNVRQQLIQKTPEWNEETEQVTNAIQTGEKFFTGMADSDALQKIGMEHSASGARVAAQKKEATPPQYAGPITSLTVFCVRLFSDNKRNLKLQIRSPKSPKMSTFMVRLELTHLSIA
jgi:hypothetical protein